MKFYEGFALGCVILVFIQVAAHIVAYIAFIATRKKKEQPDD